MFFIYNFLLKYIKIVLSKHNILTIMHFVDTFLSGYYKKQTYNIIDLNKINLLFFFILNYPNNALDFFKI